MTGGSTIGVMQGRLSPPYDNRFQSFPVQSWEAEFALARHCGVDEIEWIDDVVGESLNPLFTADGRARMRDLQAESGVATRSVCADWFMDNPLVLHVDRARWLVGCAAAHGMARIVFPFVDQSSLAACGEEDRTILAEVIRDVARCAGASGLELHLETDLDAQSLVDFLRMIAAENVRVTYDIGNCAALGFDPVGHLSAYGESLGSVHVKDRLLGGATVSLGSGAADFAVIGAQLRRLQWEGPLVLQAARGDAGGEIEQVRSGVSFVRDHLLGPAS